MGAYILRRLLLMVPTIFGIMAISFAIVQFAPGGPVERVIAQLQGHDVGATSRFTSAQDGSGGMQGAAIFAARFDFGESYYRDIPVIDLIKEKLPVSITLGLWATLLTYLISIPLGIAKARRDGSAFDVWTSGVIIVGYAIPGFLFAVALIVLFAGGSYFDWFPLRGLTSDNFDQLSLTGKALDYLWHIFLPVLALSISGFATTSLLTKNAFLDEIRKQYVVTARAKGLTERRVLYGHVFRNAMLIVIAGFPGAFIGAFFTGSLLIETIFSLDGLGLLSYESIINRDYPVVFASLYIFGLVGLVVTLISDITYMWVDPRIDFSAQGGG